MECFVTIKNNCFINNKILTLLNLNENFLYETGKVKRSFQPGSLLQKYFTLNRFHTYSAKLSSIQLLICFTIYSSVIFSITFITTLIVRKVINSGSFINFI